MAESVLFDDKGNRLYLNADERAAFLDAARTVERALKCFCHVLHYSGCRISEAFELSARRIDLAEQSLRIRSLKSPPLKSQFLGLGADSAVLSGC
jgi:integrase/recombinase XerD